MARKRQVKEANDKQDEVLVEEKEPCALVRLKTAASYDIRGQHFIKGQSVQIVGEENIEFFENDGQFLVTRL